MFNLNKVTVPLKLRAERIVNNEPQMCETRRKMLELFVYFMSEQIQFRNGLDDIGL